MKQRMLIACITAISMQFFSSDAFAQKEAELTKAKAAVISYIDEHAKELIRLSDELWAYAETALAEEQSAEALADYADEYGFTVERGVADMPTAFIASYGLGVPIIGILGEFDALSGISQKVSPVKKHLLRLPQGHNKGLIPNSEKV